LRKKWATFTMARFAFSIPSATRSVSQRIVVATEFVVEAAARHAADADFRVIVLEDCCAAFSDEAHRVSLHIMDHLATLATAADFLQSV
jgi:hypothetical protein